MTDLPDQHHDDEAPDADTPDVHTPDVDTPAPEQPADTGPPPAPEQPAGAGPTPPDAAMPAGPPPSAPPPVQQWPQQSRGDQRNWAVGAHLSALVASMVTGLAVLGPLVVYLIKKDEDRFIAEHAREALNFQLTWLIGGFVATIAAVIITVVTVGLGLIVFIPAVIGFAIAWIVFMVKASMAASRGEYYRYPLTVRLVS